MLKHRLYTFTELVMNEGVVSTHIRLNPSHPIFNGHFPGQPVLPGVCSLQIVKEILGIYLQKPMQLTKADHIKFLAVITPEADKLLHLKLHLQLIGQQVCVTAELFETNSTLFKFKGTFKEAQ